MRKNRPFWLAFTLSLSVLLLTLGLCAVDYQGRKLTFGDSTPFAQVEHKGQHAQLTLKAFGQERTWDVTPLDRAWRFLLDFGCIPGAYESGKTTGK